MSLKILSYSIILLILLPLAMAEDIPHNFSFNVYEHKEGYMIMNSLSPECREEWKIIINKDPEALVKEYCSTVQDRIVWLLFIVGLLWLFQPMFNKLVDNSNDKRYNILKIVYKWIGLGFLFIAGYAITMV